MALLIRNILDPCKTGIFWFIWIENIAIWNPIRIWTDRFSNKYKLENKNQIKRNGFIDSIVIVAGHTFID